jgi:endonuclease IV
MHHLIIWWSTGDFYRVEYPKNEDNYIERFFFKPSASAIEIMINEKRWLHCSLTENGITNNFSYCSLHAPAHNYQKNNSSYEILDYLDTLCKELPIQNVVFHPDEVIDRNVFKEYPNIPFSIENMDERKKSCQWVEDLAKIFAEYPQIKFTLDLQHAFVNDPTMQLAKDLHAAFGDRLVEYHISWFDKELLHYPLFKTQQLEIIQAVERPNIPLIIESTFDNKNELEQEIQYIQENIRF